MSHAKTLALGNGWWLVAKHFTASCQFGTGKLHALHCNNFRITAGFPLPFHMVHACMRCACDLAPKYWCDKCCTMPVGLEMQRRLEAVQNMLSELGMHAWHALQACVQCCDRFVRPRNGTCHRVMQGLRKVCETGQGMQQLSRSSEAWKRLLVPNQINAQVHSINLKHPCCLFHFFCHHTHPCPAP